MPYHAPLSRHFPVDFASSLSLAALLGDVAQIDRITDEMAKQGLVRERKDCSELRRLRDQDKRNEARCQ